MNISFVRLKGVIQELRLIRAEISRLADLKELELQSVHQVTTRATVAQPKDLIETKVTYTDPAYAEIVSSMERKAGRSLTDEEASQIMDALMAEEEA